MGTNVLLLTFIAFVGVTGVRNHPDTGKYDWRNGNNTTEDDFLSSNYQWLSHNGQGSSEFPEDIFTPKQLRQGAVILHFICALYCFALVGMVCGNYFLPSVDCICLSLNLSQNVAAATFMSFATTAPEFFTVLIGTFITESDVGLGTVIGSGMFNILGVATFGGLAAVKPVQLEWWPLLRDSSIYLLALTALFIVIHDRRITVTGASFLFSCYFAYFAIMLYNQRLRKCAKVLVKKIRKREKSPATTRSDVTQQKVIPTITIATEVPPIPSGDAPVIVKEDPDIGSFEDNTSYKAYFINYDRRSLSRKSFKSDRGSFIVRSESDFEKKESVLDVPNGTPGVQQPTETKEEDAEEFTGVNLRQRQHGSVLNTIVWVILWPGSFLLFATVPDCRVVRWRKYYPLTFLMCVVWIGITSYVGNWMISVIGDTIGIPESVMGLTFLAAGGCMPEAISTVIMARQGEGGLGFSNSLGGNTINICLCLGLPWLLKCLLHGPIDIDSQSLQYNSIALFIGVFILVSVSFHTRFNMNRRMGVICGMCYVIFVVVSALFELGTIPS